MTTIPGLQAEWDILVKIVVSFLAGALIGLEREKAKRTISKEESEYGTPPGVRSFGFIALLGSLTITIPVFASKTIGGFGQIIAISISLGMSILSILVVGIYSYYRLVILREPGITTLVALALAYAIGVGIGLGLFLESIAASVLITFMLAVKLRIEEAVRILTYEELLSALEIGIIVFLLGPFLAVDITDPWLHVINLRVLYGFFVIILILSYIGYILVKALGPRALTYFAFFGGLVHSEATVISITRLGLKIKREDDIIKGSIAAITAMVLRNLFLILGLTVLVAPPEILGMELLLTVTGFLLTILVGVFILTFRKMSKGERLETLQTGLTIEKPVSYSIALKALLVFIVVLLATTIASNIAGETGVLISSIAGGLVSAEATIFTASTLQITGRISSQIALASAILATSSAVLNKLIYMRVAGASGSLLRKLVLSIISMTIPLITTVLVLLGINI